MLFPVVPYNVWLNDCTYKNLYFLLFLFPLKSHLLLVSVTSRKFFPFCNKVRGWKCMLWQYSFINLSSLRNTVCLILCVAYCLQKFQECWFLVCAFFPAAMQIIPLPESKWKVLLFWFFFKKNHLSQKTWYKICWSACRVEVNSYRSVRSLGWWWSMTSMVESYLLQNDKMFQNHQLIL